MGWKGFAMSILQFPAPKNNVCRKTQKTNEKTNKKQSRKISLLGRNMLLLGVLSFENDIGIGIERERETWASKSAKLHLLPSPQVFGIGISSSLIPWIVSQCQPLHSAAGKVMLFHSCFPHRRRCLAACNDLGRSLCWCWQKYS